MRNRNESLCSFLTVIKDRHGTLKENSVLEEEETWTMLRWPVGVAASADRATVEADGAITAATTSCMASCRASISGAGVVGVASVTSTLDGSSADDGTGAADASTASIETS